MGMGLVERERELDANLNRHALRPNKNIGICCEPQSTCFETQQKYWDLAQEAKIPIFDRTPTQCL